MKLLLIVLLFYNLSFNNYFKIIIYKNILIFINYNKYLKLKLNEIHIFKHQLIFFIFYKN